MPPERRTRYERVMRTWMSQTPYQRMVRIQESQMSRSSPIQPLPAPQEDVDMDDASDEDVASLLDSDDEYQPSEVSEHNVSNDVAMAEAAGDPDSEGDDDYEESESDSKIDDDDEDFEICANDPDYAAIELIRARARALQDRTNPATLEAEWRCRPDILNRIRTAILRDLENFTRLEDCPFDDRLSVGTAYNLEQEANSVNGVLFDRLRKIFKDAAAADDALVLPSGFRLPSCFSQDS